MLDINIHFVLGNSALLDMMFLVTTFFNPDWHQFQIVRYRPKHLNSKILQNESEVTSLNCVASLPSLSSKSKENVPENFRCLSEIVADKFTIPNSYSIRQTFGIKKDVYLFNCVYGRGVWIATLAPQKMNFASNSIKNELVLN